VSDRKRERVKGGHSYLLNLITELGGRLQTSEEQQAAKTVAAALDHANEIQTTTVSAARALRRRERGKRRAVGGAGFL
jgi:hypothetical protein